MVITWRMSPRFLGEQPLKVAQSVLAPAMSTASQALRQYPEPD